MTDDLDDIKKEIDEIIEKADSKQESIAALHLSQTKEKIELEQKEERFIWIILVMILFDILFLKDCNNWSLPWIIGIFELIVIYMLDQKYDIKPVKVLFYMVYNAFKNKN